MTVVGVSFVIIITCMGIAHAQTAAECPTKEANEKLSSCLTRWSYATAFTKQSAKDQAATMLQCYRSSGCTNNFAQLCAEQQKAHPDLNCCNPSGTAAPDTLQQVHIIHRHGDRTSIAELPCAPITWEIGAGKLTPLGMQQGVHIGKIIREWYDGFIPCVYKNEDIEIISSTKDRTVMTAQSALQGLYTAPTFDVPFTVGTTHYVQGQSPSFVSAPIYQTVRDLDDNPPANHFIRAYTNCKKYNPDQGWTASLGTVEHMKKMEQWKSFAEEIVKKTCFDQTDTYKTEFTNVTAVLDRFYPIYDPLHCGKVHERLPPDMDKYATQNMQKIIDIQSYSFAQLFKDHGPLYGGTLLWLFKKRMEEMKNSQKGKKVYWYSGHDSTLVSIMSAIKMKWGWENLPPYASVLAFELHKTSNNDWFVRLKFRKGNSQLWTHTKDDAAIWTVTDWCEAGKPGCKTDADGMCPYDCVKALFDERGRSLEEWNKECGNPSPGKFDPTKP